MAFGIVILGMLTINTFAYPLNIQVSRSLDKVALDESDLPQGNYYVIANRREPSDVPAENIALGWTEGYQIVFLRGGQFILQQDISIYPRENASKVIDRPIALEGWHVEELPSPNIGQESRMYLLTQNEGTVERVYSIEFIKGDTYSILFSSDERLLTDMAKTAENKMPEIYIGPSILLALALVAMYLLGLLTYSVHINVREKRLNNVEGSGTNIEQTP